VTAATSAIRLGSVSLDCPDPHELAEFYARLLGVEVAFDSENFSALKLDGVWLSMQRVADHRPPTWPAPETPQQIHLDFAVDDLDAGEARAIEAGATRADDQPSPDRWRVMLDPAGHPFCLSSLIPE
jgi:catechol 2,3-dioxygenase-like lactoylglutathione lyase family enzyme